MPLNFCPILSIQWHARMQAYICLLHCALQWRQCRSWPSVTCAGGVFLQPSSAFTLWQMWWFEWCWCWPGSAVTCTGGLFLWPTSADTLLADVVGVIILQLALCGIYIYIYKTPLAHVVVSPIATCTGDIFPYTHSFLRAKKLFAGASYGLHPFWQHLHRQKTVQGRVA